MITEVYAQPQNSEIPSVVKDEAVGCRWGDVHKAQAARERRGLQAVAKYEGHVVGPDQPRAWGPTRRWAKLRRASEPIRGVRRGSVARRSLILQPTHKRSA